MSNLNLYKVRGWNGNRFVFAEDMSHAIEVFRANEVAEFEEYIRENPHLSKEELEEDGVQDEPHSVELVANASEIIK